jgi:hypothetical protein
MLATRYYYNESIKKIVAVFGSLFNDICTAKHIRGKAEAYSRVPLAYAPRAKFLERLAHESTANASTVEGPVAIRLPRMSFEISSLTPDPSAKLNRLNTVNVPIDGNATDVRRIYQSTPYLMGMSLNIYARQNDDALQILEQILPYFNPEYTITVRDLVGDGSLTDLPIILTGINLSDDYEGDFVASRRQIIYTLDFNIRVKFPGLLGNTARIIKYVRANLYDSLDVTSAPIDAVNVRLGNPDTDTPEEFTTVTTFGFADDTLPPLADRLSDVVWVTEYNTGGRFTAESLSGGRIRISAPLIEDANSGGTITVATRIYNNSADPDPAGSYDDDGMMLIVCDVEPSSVIYSQGAGDRVNATLNNVRIASHANGKSDQSYTPQTYKIAPDEELYLRLQYNSRGSTSIDATHTLNYDV